MNNSLLPALVRSSYIFFILAVVVLLSSCAILKKSPQTTAKATQPVTLKEVLGGDPDGLVTVSKKFPKEYLTNLVSHPEISNIRLVRLVRPGSISKLIEHRILDTAKTGPLRTLGFEEGDILLACHGYIVTDPLQFFRYLKALPKLPNATFDLVRKGRPIRIVIETTD